MDKITHTTKKWLCSSCGEQREYPQVHWCDDYKEMNNNKFSKICGGSFILNTDHANNSVDGETV